MSTQILIVDDDPITRELLTMQLQRNGYSVYHAGSVDEAQAWLRENKPRLVITDLVMPQRSGFELIEWLTHDDTPNVPTCILSARTDAETLSRARTAADALLTKPVDTDDLLEVARRLINS